jgi:hypothetical protein
VLITRCSPLVLFCSLDDPWGPELTALILSDLNALRWYYAEERTLFSWLIQFGSDEAIEAIAKATAPGGEREQWWKVVKQLSTRKVCRMSNRGGIIAKR